ncbi:MAG: hypothetical protein HPY60_00135 [Candidatus Methanofastidiosum sp.]|nr:hypothetical protein [Methanofastidiosum sp.]
MGKIKTLILVLALILLITIPILILGDTLNLNTGDDSTDQNAILPKDPIVSNEIKDFNMAKEMQDAIDALELKGVDISELKNLKTEYAAYSSEERLAMLEDDFETAMKYQQEKEKIVLSFSGILNEEGFYNFNIYEFTKNHNY